MGKSRSFDDANRHNPLAARNLYVACPEKSSQSKRHQLVKSAMDETLAEAMLPPGGAVASPQSERSLTRVVAHLVHYQSDSGGRQN